MHDIITTLFTRSWLLALAGAAVIGAQSVSAQTTEGSNGKDESNGVYRQTEPAAGNTSGSRAASGRNLDSGLRRRSDPYRKALVYHQPLCGRYSPIQGDSRTCILRHSCGVRSGRNGLQPGER